MTKLRVSIFALLIFSHAVQAGQTKEVNSEIDDISAESDIVVSETEEVKERMNVERKEADQALEKAKIERQAAVEKQRSAVQKMNQSEAEIEALNAQQAKLKEEFDTLSTNTAAAEKTTAINTAQIEKTKAEITTLKELSAEKNKRLLELAAQEDKNAIEIKELERQKLAAQTTLQKMKDNEAPNEQRHQKTMAEQAQKKAQLESDVKAQQRAISSLAVAQASGEMTLKRDCKFYDRPTKGLKVLGVKFSGTSVKKVDEGNNWVAFSLPAGGQTTGGQNQSQKGFVSKSCF